MFKRRLCLLALILLCALGSQAVRAQIDPVKRDLIQLGYNQPFEGQSPLAAYAFYYYNRPSFLNDSNLTLRLAVAPVYLDSELGIRNLLGENTDLGIGLAGGGFADNYYEVRKGKFLQPESFSGDGARASLSLYHLFNPGQRLPLNGILRGEAHYANYIRDNDTAPNFVLPNDLTSFNVRTGLRLGGQEPVIIPEVALELSVWYEGSFRMNSGNYGFDGDRQVEANSHLFWSRALFAYTLESKQHFMVSVTAGTSANADRFSAYRIGGFLPLASEFPLTLPGYYYQELSATRFALLNANSALPLDILKRFASTAVGSVAVMDYLPGLEQPGHWNSGAGGGLSYRSASDLWEIILDYGYGFNAIRTDGRGAQNIGLLIQINLERTKSPLFSPGENNPIIRGLDSFLHVFN